MSRVEQDLRLAWHRRQLTQDVVEGVIVQRWGYVDNGRHLRLSSPRRKFASPVAPRCSTLRAAARCAATMASPNRSPAIRREKYVAPQTSPQPVGSPTRGASAGTSAVRTAPSAPVPPRGAVDRPVRRGRSVIESKPGAAK